MKRRIPHGLQIMVAVEQLAGAPPLVLVEADCQTLQYAARYGWSDSGGWLEVFPGDAFASPEPRKVSGPGMVRVMVRETPAAAAAVEHNRRRARRRRRRARREAIARHPVSRPACRDRPARSEASG